MFNIIGNFKFQTFILIFCSIIWCISGQTTGDDSSDDTSTSTSIVNISCNKNSLKRIDELLAKVTTYGNSGRKFPENTDQLPIYCNESKSLVENIESLNKKCIDGLPKRVLTVSIFTVKSVIRQLCRKSNKLLPQYFDAAKCINRVQNKVGKCFSKSIDKLLGMQFAEHNKKIPMACCEIPLLRTCIEDVQRNIDGCTDQNIESTNRFLDSIIGNTVNLLACGEYAENTNKCDKLSAPNKKSHSEGPVR